MYRKAISFHKKCRRTVLCILATVTFAVGLTACGQDAEIPKESSVIQENSIEETVAATQDENLIIESVVCPIAFPIAASKHMEHLEVSQDGEIIEVFYLKNEDLKREVFRVLFRPCASEKDIGVMAVENRELYVSVAVSNYTDEELVDEEERDNYYTVMSALSTVLESIQSNENFDDGKGIEFQQSNKNFTYWTVSLPAQMEWEESSAVGYQITYYGNINGNRIKLYTIYIGDSSLKNELGYYHVDNQWEQISLESYELPSTEGWEDSHITELYTMMATINDVIQAIMSSENFSAQIPE